jgi:hypothetical protein
LKATQLGVAKPTTYFFSSGGFFKKLNLNHVDLNTVVIGNFDVTSSTSSVTFAHTGWWYDYMSGDSLQVTGATQAITLAAGDWRVYLDKRVSNPYLSQWKALASVVSASPKGRCVVMPNPAHGGFEVALDGVGAQTGQLRVMDMAGRTVYEGVWNAGDRIGTSQWQAGNYWILLNTTSGIYRSHLVVE